MAIQYTEPERQIKITYRRFEVNVQAKQVFLYFQDEAGNDQVFSSNPSQWAATLSFLFDNLTDAAELKDRIESYLIANEIIGGTKVPD